MESQLWELRRERGFSQMCMGVAAKETPTWVSFMERHSYVPGEDICEPVAKALISPEDAIWPPEQSGTWLPMAAGG